MHVRIRGRAFGRYGPKQRTESGAMIPGVGLSEEPFGMHSVMIRGVIEYG